MWSFKVRVEGQSESKQGDCRSMQSRWESISVEERLSAREDPSIGEGRIRVRKRATDRRRRR